MFVKKEQLLKGMKLFSFRWIIGAVIVIAAGIVIVRGRKVEKPVVISTEEKKEGVGALGYLEPHSRVVHVSPDIGSEGAVIGQLHVEEGQAVKKGDLIATLMSEQRRQAAYQEACAKVEALEASLAIEKREVTFRQTQNDRCQQLFKAQAASTAQRDEALRDYQKAQKTVVTVQANLAAAQASKAVAKAQLDQCYVYAPLSGQILKIHARSGERIGNKGIVDMADIKTMEVVAEVNEEDMPGVFIGQKAEIRIPGSSEVIVGRVVQHSFEVKKATLVEDNPQSPQDQRTVEVRIACEGKLPPLIGQEVIVRLKADQPRHP